MDDPNSLITVGKLLTVVVLVLANGFFVAAEFSLVAVRRSRVQQLMDEGHPLAPALQRATSHLDAYLAATQLGITMASIGLGWVGEPVLAGIIEPALHFLPTSWELIGAEVIAIALAFSLVTVLHIVLGELAPKSLALQRSERTALVASKPLELFLTVFRPAILALNGLGNRTVRLFGLDPAGGEGSTHSVEELQLLVAASRNAGLVSEGAEEIVERAFRLDDLAARQVMVPRVEIVGVPIGTSLAAALAIAVESHHTHLPVYRGSIDDIVGVVNVLDLLRARPDERHQRLEEVMRPALLVPETVTADVLLTTMQDEGKQLAILVDEYAGTAGLVTVHDLVEELVGPMPDSDEEGSVVVLPDGSISMSGLTPIHEMKERFGLRLPDGEFDTVAGFILASLGRMARPDDQVIVDGYRFRVETLDGKRIERVRLERLDPGKAG